MQFENKYSISGILQKIFYVRSESSIVDFNKQADINNFRKLLGYVKDTNAWIDVFGLHEVIGSLDGVPVTTPKGGYSWYSTPGSSKAPFNGFGARGHSEAKLLEHLESTKGGNLKGTNLEIISMGQMTKGGKGQLSTLPPCDRCLKGLEAFANKHEMDISYKWEGGEVTFKGYK